MAESNVEALKKLEKEEKALKKSKDKWKLYIDYLLRHQSIVTSKYMAWEKNEFELFKEALEKSQRLDEKDQSNAPTIKKLKLRCGVLETKKYITEANMIKKYLDFIERLKGLNSVAKDLVKLLKKSKIEDIEELVKHFDFWKAFVAINTNLAVLETKDVDFNHPGMRYVVWICLVRTTLNIVNKFLKEVSSLTQIPLTSVDQFVAFNLSEEQKAVSQRLEETFAGYKEEVPKPELGLGANLTLKALSKVSNNVEQPTEEVKLPGETEYLTFELGSEPPASVPKKIQEEKVNACIVEVNECD